MSMGGGSAGKTSTTQQSSQTDPWLSKTNELAYNQIKAGVEQTGGLPAYLNPNPYALPTGTELGTIGQIGNAAITGEQAAQTPQETQGFTALGELADPNMMLGRASELYNQYGAPIVKNNATVAGQGRGGAVPEALASGFGQMTLPILQNANAAKAALASANIQQGPALQARRQEQLQTLLGTQQYPRMQQSAEYMRPLSTIANMIGALPLGGGQVTGYQTGKSSATQGDMNWMTDVIVPLIGSLAGAAAAGCWVATACVGPAEAIWSRIYLSTLAPWYIKVPYMLFGKGLAWLARRSSWLRRKLAPTFRRWADTAYRDVVGCRA